METANDPQPEFELRLEKLRLEIEEMKRNGAWNRRLGRYLPVLSTVIPLVALLLTIMQLRHQSEAAALTAQRGFMEPVLTRQLNTYFEASGAAATIAGSQDADEQKKAREAFFRLYWGPLVMLESKEVSGAMKGFGWCLEQADRCGAADLQRRSLLLSSTLQNDLFESWKLTPEQYASRMIDYQKNREAWHLDEITGPPPTNQPGPTPANSPTPRVKDQRKPVTRSSPANTSTPRPAATPAIPTFEKGPTPNPTPRDPKIPDPKVPN
jgi:hypothetical protein